MPEVGTREFKLLGMTIEILLQDVVQDGVPPVNFVLHPIMIRLD